VITIVVASSKGGAGKSTLSVHLSVAAWLVGERVLLLDADPQGSSFAWSQAREADGPTVRAVEPSEVQSALRKAASEGYGVVFIDTQPRAAASLTNIARGADLAVLPVRPTPFDLDTSKPTARIVAAAGVPFAFVLNACKPRSPDIALSREVLAEVGSVFEETIGDRTVYARSLQTGRSCQEYEPTSDAAREIARLWSEIARRTDVVPTR
jgi:chromosome partitioning protein